MCAAPSEAGEGRVGEFLLAPIPQDIPQGYHLSLSRPVSSWWTVRVLTLLQFYLLYCDSANQVRDERLDLSKYFLPGHHII